MLKLYVLFCTVVFGVLTYLVRDTLAGAPNVVALWFSMVLLAYIIVCGGLAALIGLWHDPAGVPPVKW